MRRLGYSRSPSKVDATSHMQSTDIPQAKSVVSAKWWGFGRFLRVKPVYTGHDAVTYASSNNGAITELADSIHKTF